MSTFKAKIVSSDLYHEYQRVGFFAGIVFSIGMALVTDLLPMGSFSQGILFVAIVLIAFQQLKMKETMQSLIDQQRIEITPDVILTIDHNNVVVQKLKVCDAQEITIDEKYTYAEDSAGGFWKLIKKKPLSNTLTVKSESQQHDFQFLIDSHYMAVQIEKIISGWKEQGYQILTNSITKEDAT